MLPRDSATQARGFGWPGLIIIALLGAGCATAPARAPAAGATGTAASGQASAGDPVSGDAVRLARAQVGAPYRYGGSGPDAFDCSGLVRYVFGQAGVSLPRTAEEQQAATEPVDLDRLEPGDLVFFRLPDAHVGIYAGDGVFIHAPGAGRSVTVARLNEPWFILAFAGAGRVAHGR